MPSEWTHPGVYVEEVPSSVRRITGVATSIAAFVGAAKRGPTDDPVTINSFADFERIFGGLWVDSCMSYAVRDFYLNGGSQAIIVRVTNSAAASEGDDGAALGDAQYLGSRDNQTGIFALLKTDLFNILCIPPMSHSTDVTASTVLSGALALCVERRAMLLVDPPSGWQSVADAVTGISSFPLSGEDARNAAMFFPRLRQPDPQQDGRVDDFVPCGAVAGIFARTDQRRGVWKAPAGMAASLNGVPALQISLTDDENGRLNSLAVNCLRSFGERGRVVWGSRTMRGADHLAHEWKYVPVRRTALYIEESLSRGTRWAVFEPNDEPLWAQIRLNVSAFLHNLFLQGAFQGTTPRDAYFVKCDEETTTPNDIKSGIVNIVVGFAPLKPVEFVIIKLQQLAGKN